MRTICRNQGSFTSFIISELEEAYQDAARRLYYRPAGDTFVKSFPSDTPNLDVIYRNFERDAEEMLLQTAGIRPVPWEEALLTFIEIVKGSPVDWWLGGSGALAVRGLDIVPRDLDIIVDGAGARMLGEILSAYLVEPVLPSKDWIANWFGRAFLYARIEWVGDVAESSDGTDDTDFGLAAAKRLDVITWKGYQIRVPPLDLQLKVSEKRGLLDRAAIIKEAISASR